MKPLEKATNLLAGKAIDLHFSATCSTNYNFIPMLATVHKPKKRLGSDTATKLVKAQQELQISGH
ncbi:hypothetical protein ACU8KH_03582 [Lachancea thermotolerans]